MKSLSRSPVVKHLVLIGGGHSHLAVLKRLAMKPVPGLAVTLISREISTPYSGSLPGYITGHYQHEEIHIDLRPLAQFAGVRIVQQEITAIDLENRVIHCDSRPSMEFDLLSLNIGSRPDACKIPGAELYAIGIKPIDQFLQRWQQIYQQAIDTLRDTDQTFVMTIVGGGPASVELAFAAHYRIHKTLGLKLSKQSGLLIRIVSADPELLMGHNAKVRRYTTEELTRRNIEILCEHRVLEFKAGKVICEHNKTIASDIIVYATGASIPLWPGKCGLAIGEDGFIEVNQYLQSTSHDFVFASGDAASMQEQPRPKSGVFAVRHGKPLAENLIRYATGRKLRRFTPQRHALALINLANKSAIASRNKLFLKGRWIWSLKNWIDTGFIRKYSELPAMEQQLELAKGLLDKEAEQALKAHAMRCAGCGAKVAGNLLDEVLQELPQTHKADIVVPESRVEDASRIQLDDGRILLQSIDQISAFVNDPYVFAKIATNHCLSDIYAMGCDAHSVLAVVGLPFASKSLQKSHLRELMLGCSAVLLENECSLLGGHTAEMSELSFGLCVNGFSTTEELLTKHGMGNGDVVLITKPLGTGTLLAADMRARAKHEWIAQALDHMLQSNRQAAVCLRAHQASSCTDITGFGLAGHLLEMLESGGVELELDLEDLPLMDGAIDCLNAGIFSSLHQDNSLNARFIFNSEAFRNDLRFEMLFDPQTSGGLVASLPQANASACLQALHAAGYSAARIIGRVGKVGASAPALILK